MKDLHENTNLALIVIDIQKSDFADIDSEDKAIPEMPDYAKRMLNTRLLIDECRKLEIPVIFIQEIHRNNLVDFGRELDGDEKAHCLDNNPLTELAVEEMGILPNDYKIQKRRYSAFYGTDLEILLKGLSANTLILTGGLTDVCVHYTFVDAHQGDYHCYVVEDCTAGSSEDAHTSALKAMAYLQNGTVVKRSEMIEKINLFKK